MLHLYYKKTNSRCTVTDTIFALFFCWSNLGVCFLYSVIYFMVCLSKAIICFKLQNKNVAEYHVKNRHVDQKKEKKIKCSVMLFNRCGCTSIRACWVCLKILILLQLQRKKNILIIHFRYHYWYTYMYFLVFSYKMYDRIELMQLELL